MRLQRLRRISLLCVSETSVPNHRIDRHRERFDCGGSHLQPPALFGQKCNNNVRLASSGPYNVQSASPVPHVCQCETPADHDEARRVRLSAPRRRGAGSPRSLDLRDLEVGRGHLCTAGAGPGGTGGGGGVAAARGGQELAARACRTALRPPEKTVCAEKKKKKKIRHLHGGVCGT